MRIGHGYDVHRLVSGRKCIIGGVEIPYDKGLLGHSDADVLLHAVADALLGAAACGDIGTHFPDTDEKFKGADSLELLAKAAQIISDMGYKVVNIDATVIAEQPKMKPYINKMRENIAAACSCAAEQVSVKATTQEGLGFTGRGDGIAAHAVCLIDCKE
ncbi:MAG: 2-C-methyl-D-erythritol 2,4-cyclodiphosphate synthase [Clostridiales bacterium]|nr:2-C-methyl-D-erythritol 2,4-cyclodiphosphate synthase [Clostridiales bacterium]